MNRYVLLFTLAGLTAYAAEPEPRLKLLPDNIQATRIQSGTFLRLLPHEETDAAGNKSLRLMLDDGLTGVEGGWYFTNLGYDRFLTVTNEMQVELGKLRALQESCTQPTVVHVTSPVGGFSAQTVAIAFVVGVVVGGVIVVGATAR